MKKITFLMLLALSANSIWSQCDAVPSYVQDFESATIPGIPTCTTAINAGGGNNWETVNNPGNGFESNTLKYGSSAVAADAWFFTGGIELSAGTLYVIRYRYGNSSTTTTENLTVTMGAAPTIAAANTFTTHTITSGAPATNVIEPFPVTESGTYYFGFHANSAANQGNIYIDDFKVEPMVCGTPSNVAVGNITHNSATITWEASTNGNTNMFSVYQYAFSTTDTPPAEGSYEPGTSVDLTALTPDTTYYVFTRSLCGPLWSDWTEVVAFTTPCTPSATPYIQDFESATVPAIPACTSIIKAGEGNKWVTVNNPGSGFANKTLHYSESEVAANAWFFTQGIQLTAGTMYKVSYKYGNDSATTSENLKVTVGTSPNVVSAGPFAEHLNITGGTQLSNAVEFFNVPATGVYYFGFNATSAASQGSLYVDDIRVEELVCGNPDNVAITNVTHNSATISWEVPTNGNSGTISVYQYAVLTENTAPAEGTFNPDLSVDVTGLAPSTTYYVFTRTMCGPLWSAWGEVVTFTTAACAPAAVPYNLDFEAPAAPAIPDCTSIDTAETGNDWVTVSNPGNGFTTQALHYAESEEAANAWFYTRGIELTAGTYYKIAYKFGNDSATTTERLKVMVGNSPDAVSQTTLLGNHIVTGGTLQQSHLDFFTVPATGVYYFGFNAISVAGQGSLYVDDFVIEDQVCGTPSEVEITDITDVSATVSWEAPTTGNSTIISVYQYAFSTTDAPPAEGTLEPGTTVDLTGLTPETTYYVFTRTMCGPIWSDWTTTSFTTEETLGNGSHSFKAFAAFPNPVKDIITITATGNMEKAEVYNVTGQLVHGENIDGNTATINLQKLAAGAYLLNVQSSEGSSKTIKIIKE